MKALSECPVDQADDSVVAQVTKAIMGLEEKPTGGLLAKRFSQYLGMLRAMYLWYHGAHHAVRGAAFAGDHAEIFGKFYRESNEEFDGAVEKAVGLTQDEGMSCPIHITKLALQVLQKYPSPPTVNTLSMFAVALQLENDYIEMVSQMFAELEEAEQLSLGLNDFLMASANDHESRVYFLQQRIKTSLEN